MSARPTSLAAVLLVLTLGLTGCGAGDDKDATTTPVAGATPSAAPSGGPGSGLGGGLDLDAVRRCLEAAGLEDALPSDLPTGQPSGRPTGVPSDFATNGTPPSGFPSAGPSGDGFFQAFQDPDVQAALQACGIDLPTGRPSALPS
jgi:hypothetical protein